jgi:hypothetical protein
LSVLLSNASDDEQGVIRVGGRPRRALHLEGTKGRHQQAHAEAFAQLTPEQRRQVLADLGEHVPAGERGGDDPQSLARTATRAEMREPGVLERSMGAGRGPGMGGMLAGSLLASVAGAFIGTSIAGAFLADDGDAQAQDDSGAGEEGSGDQPGETAEDSGGDASGGFGGDAGGDFGSGLGDGDLGGGDFGGI